MVRNLRGCTPRPAAPGKGRRAVWVQHSARLTPTTHGDIMAEATERTTKTLSAPPPKGRGKLTARGAATTLALPPMLPPSADEQAHSASMVAQMQAITERLHQRNLDSAVRLAVLAANRQLPVALEDHFSELGRRYSDMVGICAKPKATKLRPRLVVNNGAEVAR